MQVPWVIAVVARGVWVPVAVLIDGSAMKGTIRLWRA
jgi:hypothetical protein